MPTIAAVATLHPAIELADLRYTSDTAVGAPQLIADDACANLFILGPALPRPWRHIDLAVHRVSATVAGKSRHDDQGANVLGDPRRALTWIANELFVSLRQTCMKCPAVLANFICQFNPMRSKADGRDALQHMAAQGRKRRER